MISAAPTLGIRWTIGDVSDRGFEALHLSIQGAWRLFGEQARYVVCVNTIDLNEARRKTGEVPDAVDWRATTPEDIPAFLREHLSQAMAEGVAWKLAPLRL